MHDIPLNFVYNNPTITQLASFLHKILSGQEVDKDAEHIARLAQMAAMLTKYASTFPKPSWHGSTYTNGDCSGKGPSQETILITGTTGRLGSHLLSQILERPGIVHVYALNRGAPEDCANMEKRHREVFRAWGLDEHVLSSGRVTFLSGDLSKPRFNLNQETFEQVRNLIAQCSQSSVANSGYSCAVRSRRSFRTVRVFNGFTEPDRWII